MAEAMHNAVKVSIGTGYSTSATIGAKITMPREKKLAMPIEVTEKRVGNMRG